jgi:hypothetical protein
VDSQQVRSEYKNVWSALSTTKDQAKLHVIGVTEEVALQLTETVRHNAGSTMSDHKGRQIRLVG